MKDQIEALLDHPEGCKCGNNGGGDCDWCRAAKELRTEIQEQTLPNRNGGPAFPGCGQVFTTDARGRCMPQSAWGLEGAEGMSLRDWFAGMALAHPATHDTDPVQTKRAQAAGWAYGVADAMLAARKQVQP